MSTWTASPACSETRRDLDVEPGAAPMILITEQQVEALADYASLLTAMDEVFIACARKDVDNYPFVRSPLRGGQALFGIKSGCNYSTGDLGLKCGGYWNGNGDKGLDRHQSTILLLDIETGQPRALVAGNNLTAFRTAAAAAAAARRLARPDASRVAILGAGRQALFQLKALCQVRPIASVAAWAPTTANVAALGDQVRALGLEFVAAPTPAAAVRNADIIVTVTPSAEPLLHLADIAPGAHINAMGSDTQGKRELSADLMAGARVWADDLPQAGQIGECQHLPSLAAAGELGDLLTGGFQRREGEITIFDGTGLALQDLAAASLIMAAAIKDGGAQTVAF
jgi:ornithine cyclodeaminase/alanine dehydrogenase-like protein (mu-crystallin family)